MSTRREAFGRLVKRLRHGRRSERVRAENARASRDASSCESACRIPSYHNKFMLGSRLKTEPVQRDRNPLRPKKLGSARRREASISDGL